MYINILHGIWYLMLFNRIELFLVCVGKMWGKCGENILSLLSYFSSSYYESYFNFKKNCKTL